MKKLHLLISALIAVAVCVGFAACGGDEDEDGKGPSGGGDIDPSDYAALIIGMWTETGEYTGDQPDENGYNYGFIFRSNGAVVEFGSGRSESTYKISGQRLMIYEDYYDEYEEYLIIELTENKLVLRDMDDPEYGDDTYYRVSGNVGGDVDPEPEQPSDDVARKIIGTWTETGEYTGDQPDENGYNYGFIFRADGTIVEFGSGRSESTYKISGQRLMIYEDYYDEYDEYLIVELTENKLVLRDMDDLEYGDDTYYRVK